MVKINDCLIKKELVKYLIKNIPLFYIHEKGANFNPRVVNFGWYTLKKPTHNWTAKNDNLIDLFNEISAIIEFVENYYKEYGINSKVEKHEN